MTCYQRHLRPLFDSIGLAYDKDNRERVDVAIRQLLGLGETAQCPEVWASLKALSPEKQADLPAHVAELIMEQGDDP